MPKITENRPDLYKEQVLELTKKTLKITPQVHLKVFSKKSFNTESPSRMKPGKEVILDFLQSTDATGNQLVRVRKDGSTRTFYTNSQFAQEVMA